MQTLTTPTHRSQLAFVDIQTRLVSVMQADDMALVNKNCQILAQAAKRLSVPMLCTEQYAKALGNIIPELAAHLSTIQPIEKVAFACTDVPTFCSQLTQDRPQLLLAGIEAHICILQTAFGLLQKGKQVFVIEDAIASRNPANKRNAIARMREAGCVITNTESVVFEWLGKAGGDDFKAISKLIR